MNKTIPQFTIKQMLESGVHFGHKTSRWNPQMAPFIYGERNGVHIIDLQKTAPLFYNALSKVYEVAKNNGKILFVGTKRQAVELIKEAAVRSGQYFVNKRWLGGMLTNWNTVSKSIKTLEDIEKIIEEAKKDETGKYSKKELLDLDRKRAKLEESLGGIRKMNGKPDLIFVVDSYRESIAIKEANKLGIPVISIVDTNGRPYGVDFIIPGNDDASRAIKFYCDTISDTILQAIEHSLAASGIAVEEEFAEPKDSLLEEKNAEKSVSSPEEAALETPVKEKKKTATSKGQEAVQSVKKEDAKKPAAKASVATEKKTTAANTKKVATKAKAVTKNEENKTEK